MTTVRTLLRGQGPMADPAEGTFGARAEDAVKAFPAARALPADGSAGTATWAALRTGR